ncbi:hypothetical protein JHK87_040752 [Glycine soja]|nr:hypothetical protein JHK87_040752 [Glycine soja]
MTCSCFSNSKSIDSSHHSLDHVPLSQRLKLLHPPILQNDTRIPLTLQFDAVVKKEHEGCDSQAGIGTHEWLDYWQEGADVMTAVRLSIYPMVEKELVCPTFETDACGVEKTSANVILARCPTLSAFDGRATIKVEDYEIPSSSVDKGKEASIQLDFPIPKVKKEIPEGIVDDLDHIVLKERLRMLLARFSSLIQQNLGNPLSIRIILLVVSTNGLTKQLYCGSTTCNSIACLSHSMLIGSWIQATFQRKDNSYSKSPFDIYSFRCSSCVRSIQVTMQNSIVLSRSLLSSNGEEEVEETLETMIVPLPVAKSELTLKVACELMCLITIEEDATCGSSLLIRPNNQTRSQGLKLPGLSNASLEGGNAGLLETITEQTVKKVNEEINFADGKAAEARDQTQPSSSMSSPIFSKSAEPSSIKSRRKRKKTATDSVQEALEEDAPGLLQVLLDKGVLVDEIKLYGEKEDDEALDESFCEDSFSKLEALITKIFPQRYSFLKLPNTRASKASRASYWLACLISLVEQTRYLKFRKWPVEWGWCRDLQSFIFVFERHNRIVLERPEYGYATYFFELVESLPVEWQLKRLVIAMKLTTCSRISIIENKELVVGEDLSEGEAKVLMEYGWTPNTGLGTMLNYCGRVVHDRKSEDNSSEWRSKIGKLLMDGYNGGTIVMPTVPKKVAEYMCSQSPDSDISCSSPMSD